MNRQTIVSRTRTLFLHGHCSESILSSLPEVLVLGKQAGSVSELARKARQEWTLPLYGSCLARSVGCEVIMTLYLYCLDDNNPLFSCKIDDLFFYSSLVSGLALLFYDYMETSQPIYWASLPWRKWDGLHNGPVHSWLVSCTVEPPLTDTSIQRTPPNNGQIFSFQNTLWQ